MEKVKVQMEMEQFFKMRVEKDPKIYNAYLRIHSQRHDININTAAGEEAIHADQPFFIASISEIFTSVLFGILIEQGQCDYEEKITQYLDSEILKNLHIFKDKDYTNEIKIKHLLNNTSGLHDFFEEKPAKGKAMLNLILNEPNRTWTPREVIIWAKENMKTHFPPGKGFHYSDTGYHLLGLIIEKITGLPFYEVLHQNIFEPLGMRHSHFSKIQPLEESPYEIAKLYVGNTDISNHQSLRSMVFAGGGIVSTTHDLLLFMKALVSCQIVKKDTLDRMKNDWGKFFLGIDYGYGLMNIKTIPLLMPAKYNSWGNAGSTGSFMFYHPATDAYIIGTFNQSGYGQKGIRFMLQMADKLLKATKKSGGIHVNK